MTRNEWIAETAARLAATRTSDTDALIVRCALDLAECLESQGLAPWQSAPPLTKAAAKVGGPWDRVAKLAVDLEKEAHYYGALNIFPVAEELKAIARANVGSYAAVRAYKESVK